MIFTKAITIFTILSSVFVLIVSANTEPTTILFAMPPTYSHSIGALEIAKYYKEKYPNTIIDFFWHSKYFEEHKSDINFLKFANETVVDDILSEIVSATTWMNLEFKDISKLLKGVKMVYSYLIDDIESAVKSKKYDLIVSHLVNAAATDVADKYNIPLIILYSPVVMGTGGVGEVLWLPSLSHPVSPQDSRKLSQRLKAIYEKVKLIPPMLSFSREMDALRRKSNMVERGLSFGIEDHLVLVYSTWGLEYPRSLDPLIQLVGTPFLNSAVGVLQNSKESYLENLNKMNSKAYNVIVTFGSLIRITEEFANELLSGLLDADENLHIILIDRSKEIKYSHERVVIKTWVDQKAIIEHPKTKFVVSHCGSKGFIESVLNEKPILAIPFVGDQPLTAQRAKEKGVAIVLNRRDLNREIVRNSAKEIISRENEMRENLLKLKTLLQTEDGRVNTAKWINIVLTTKGYDHLKPVFKVPFWIEHHLDIALSILAITISVLSGIVLSVVGLSCCIYFVIQRRTSHKKVD